MEIMQALADHTKDLGVGAAGCPTMGSRRAVRQPGTGQRNQQSADAELTLVAELTLDNGNTRLANRQP